jgi:hypothetical protein
MAFVGLGSTTTVDRIKTETSDNGGYCNSNGLGVRWESLGRWGWELTLATRSTRSCRIRHDPMHQM